MVLRNGAVLRVSRTKRRSLKRKVDLGDTTFFVGREFILVARGKEMSLWRQKLFLFLSRNSQNAIDYFNIPPSRVVELGMQVETASQESR
jgi:KUP system potassium uptake protein